MSSRYCPSWTNEIVLQLLQRFLLFSLKSIRGLFFPFPVYLNSHSCLSSWTRRTSFTIYNSEKKIKGWQIGIHKNIKIIKIFPCKLPRMYGKLEKHTWQCVLQIGRIYAKRGNHKDFIHLQRYMHSFRRNLNTFSTMKLGLSPDSTLRE